MARYDKLHVFDVNLPNGEIYRESATVRPGDGATVADTPWGRLGLTICYDIRFPHLHRQLAKAGAAMIAVPAAFTPEGWPIGLQIVGRRFDDVGVLALASTFERLRDPLPPWPVP